MTQFLFVYLLFSLNQQPATISFLKSNHFDFNKAFIHGVSSLRRNDEKRLLDEIEASAATNANSEKLEVTKGNVRIIMSTMEKVLIIESVMI